MIASGSGNRRLASWIDGFCEYTQILSSPKLFKKWAAISTLACAMEQKIWVRTKGSELYPNLYVILTATPGIGKSTVMKEVELLLRTIPEFYVAPSSVSAASLIDSLFDAKRKIVRPAANPPFVEFNALSVIASEFGVFLPDYDNIFMNTLNKLYDREFFEDRKRGGKLHIKIPKPSLNILGGTTPSYLNSMMPEGAWEQGFASRSIIVYSGESVLGDLFREDTDQKISAGLHDSLVADLRMIADQYGMMAWTPEAQAALTSWYMAGGPPIPDHSKLIHYTSRRTAHLIKLCMIASIDRSNERIINVEDYSRALEWLIEVETYMPDIFRAMTSGGDSRTIEDCWHFIWTTFAKEQKPIPEHRIIHFLQQRVPSHSVLRVLELMEKSNLIEMVAFGDKGRRLFKPTPKALH